MLPRAGLLTNKLVQQTIGKGSTKLDRKSRCSNGGDGECPTTDKPACRIGPSPCNSRTPPQGYAPTRLSTNTFKLPPFIRAKSFRPMRKKEQLGPKAGKCEVYKNPEYYSYHRFSFYELMMAANTVKSCIECCT